MPYSERVGNVAAVVATILVVSYFVAHQIWSTGFFTAEFGNSEMLLLHSSIMFGIVTAIVKALLGRKNLARPLEIFGLALFTAAFAWLFVIFPFDFAYFSDVPPSVLRFLVQWVSNDIARVLMAVGIVVSPLMTIYTTMLYAFVRREPAKETQRIV